jgi:predicted SnoaL-like aldol condensation-catalyzing enzyme
MTSVSELNKRKVQLFVEAVWNEGRLELIDELVAADHLGHVSCLREPLVGPEGVRRFVSSRRRACPDLYIKIEDEIAEHDLVVLRWRATAGAPQPPGSAGGQPFWSGISVIRVLAGKLVDTHTAMTPARSPVPA